MGDRYGIATTATEVGFFVEHNLPATFRRPLWSFMGDYKMLVLMLAGYLDAQPTRAERTSSEQAARRE